MRTPIGLVNRAVERLTDPKTVGGRTLLLIYMVAGTLAGAVAVQATWFERAPRPFPVVSGDIHHEAQVVEELDTMLQVGAVVEMHLRFPEPDAEITEATERGPGMMDGLRSVEIGIAMNCDDAQPARRTAFGGCSTLLLTRESDAPTTVPDLWVDHGLFLRLDGVFVVSSTACCRMGVSMKWLREVSPEVVAALDRAG